MTRLRGFSLIEVLVAVAVLAVMGTIAFTALNQMALQSGALREEADRFKRVTLAMQLVEADFRYAIPRGVRDLLGSSMPAMAGDRRVVALTRAGVPNPLQIRRSELMRVEYQFESGTLRRLVWPVLDRTQSSQPFTQVLLEDVDQIELEYFNTVSGEWTRSWPPVNDAALDLDAWPGGVRMAIDSDRFGHLERVISLAKIPEAPNIPNPTPPGTP